MTASRLKTIKFFRNHGYSHVKETGSTNDDLKKKAAEGRFNEVLVADYQTAGRGRFSRKWEALPGRALLFSFSFEGNRQKIFPVSLIAGISIIEALKDIAKESLWLKWPNDVYLNDSKLAGILVENLFFADRLVHIVGIGLNLQKPANMETAASLNEIKTEVSADNLMLKILECFSGLISIKNEELEKRFCKYSAPLWNHGFWHDQEGKRTMVWPESLEEDGSLQVHDKYGKKHGINSGSLILIRWL